MDVHEIGNRIKQARTLRNYTLDDIAHEIGVAKSTIQRYENGLIRRPKLPVLQAIAQSVQVNPAWLAGYDVPMEKKAFEQQWDKESQQLEDKISAFYHQLKGLGWSYEWLDTEKMYLLSNETTSIKITAEEYGKLVDESEEFCRKQLQKLLLKSSSLLLNAAHERTDIEVTDEMRKHDDDIMNDDSEWE